MVGWMDGWMKCTRLSSAVYRRYRTELGVGGKREVRNKLGGIGEKKERGLCVESERNREWM